MEFYLHYDGPLKSNDGAKGKHAIRSILSRQLKSICTSSPFLPAFEQDFKGTRSEGNTVMFKDLGGKRFWFLVNGSLSTVVDLSITLLAPNQSGSTIVQGGDIDNRIKTLFDALRIPQNSGEVPADDNFDYSDKGMFCLLEDDRLINSVTIRTFQDHAPANDKSCRVLLHVTTRITAALWGNLYFA
jgi:hypothetical protein